jgi:hypothetical protein
MLKGPVGFILVVVVAVLVVSGIVYWMEIIFGKRDQ